VQDTAYMVIVPKICPDAPPLKKNPVYLYTSDDFKSPEPFRPDVIVPVDDVFAQKICALHAMPSQFYEWLPWTSGDLDKVPKTNDERRAYLEKTRRDEMSNSMKTAAEKMYGSEIAGSIKLAEAFQICEYGRQPSRSELRQLFPFLPPFAG
ncbi:MAG: PIG-L family deacetylase, partial [Candidatus Latescibacterota bacterium]